MGNNCTIIAHTSHINNSAKDGSKVLMIFQNPLFSFFACTPCLKIHASYFLTIKDILGSTLKIGRTAITFSGNCQEPMFPSIRSMLINHLLFKHVVSRHHILKHHNIPAIGKRETDILFLDKNLKPWVELLKRSNT